MLPRAEFNAASVKYMDEDVLSEVGIPADMRSLLRIVDRTPVCGQCWVRQSYHTVGFGH